MAQPLRPEVGPGLFAPDHSPLLTRSTLLSIRRAMHAARDGWPVRSLIDRAAQDAASDARRAGASAAHMVIALKQEWAAIPDAMLLEPAGERRLREDLIASSIAAYFDAGLAP